MNTCKLFQYSVVLFSTLIKMSDNNDDDDDRHTQDHKRLQKINDVITQQKFEHEEHTLTKYLYANHFVIILIDRSAVNKKRTKETI